MQETYDYVVIGAGSAGCVVANRLVIAGKRVLLLEHGPKDNHPFIHIPGGFVKVLGTRHTWKHKTEQEESTGGRSLTIPQGRTLGGSSSLNAMIYIRGQAADYDAWEAAGCDGWGYADMLDLFRRSERNLRLAGRYHGTEGNLPVSDPAYRHPLSYAFLRAAQQAGYVYNHDFNGAEQAGVGFYQATIDGVRRGSMAVSYLKPVRNNPLLTVRTDCNVTGVVLENGAASGIEYRDRAGMVHSALARAEVVLCAGAMGSPKLLLQSGIGPGAELTALGIPVRRDLPGVGENYQDHIAASVYGVTDRPISLHGHDRGLRALRHGLQYVLTGSGLLTSNVVETGGFIDTSGAGRPDIQFHVTPALVGDADRTPMNRHGMSINPCILRPKSRGKVWLRSRDPDAPLHIRSGALAEAEDAATLVRGVKAARQILRAPALAKLGFTELAPSSGDEVSDADLEAYVRRAAKTVYHPAGTCKMGRDNMSVVDPSLRVIGVGRLRVADASIIPSLISGNTNAVCVAIGERCADLLLAQG